MSLTAGVLSQSSVASEIATIASTAASGGTGPYTQQLYMSTTSGFSPGGGNIVSGATALTNQVTGLTPGTIYYFKMVYTDTGNSNVTVTSAQLTVTTAAPVLSQNAFAQSPYLATLDQSFNYNTRSVQIDNSATGIIYAGCAVKIIASSQGPGGVPKVVPCTADTDEVYGFIIFNFKDVAYVPGSFCEISQNGNVQYLYATGAISPGQLVTVDLHTNGGVAASTAPNNIVGNAMDQATAAGQLIRVNVTCPSYLFQS